MYAYDEFDFFSSITNQMYAYDQFDFFKIYL